MEAHVQNGLGELLDVRLGLLYAALRVEVPEANAVVVTWRWIKAGWLLI